MEQNQNFNLKWADFTSNLQTTYSQLRSDQHFTDVTLACEDGQQIKAHKVILSSSSLRLDRILKLNDHPKPLIYLTGIKMNELTHILDFIYNGEVEIISENINRFLAVAEGLKIKGLTESNGIKENTKILENIADIPIAKISIKKEYPNTEFKTIQIIENFKKENPVIFPCNHCGKHSTSKQALERHFYRYHYGKNEDIPNDENLQNDEFGQTIEPEDNETFECELCGKSRLSNAGLQLHKLNYHLNKEDKQIEQQHGDVELDFNCGFCGKSSISKNGLQHHMSRYHLHKNDIKSLAHCNSVDIKGDQDETNSLFICVVCEKSSISKVGLQQHMFRYHTKKPDDNNQEEQAKGKYEFLSMDHDVKKLSSTTGLDETVAMYKCDLCEKTSTTKNGLSQHKSRHHRNSIANVST